MKKIFAKVITLFGGIAIGAVGAMEFAETEYKKEKQRADRSEYFAQKHLKMFHVLKKWIDMKQKGKNLSTYFIENGYKKIAIYGMGDIGNTLMTELENTDVQVVYGIDQRADSLKANINIISIAEPIEKVDVIVITALADADSIKLELGQKVDYPIITIEEIVDIDERWVHEYE